MISWRMLFMVLSSFPGAGMNQGSVSYTHLDVYKRQALAEAIQRWRQILIAAHQASLPHQDDTEA